jgi:hypothetical protein
MAYHVQVEVVHGTTHHIGWFECSEALKFSREEIYGLWPDTILMDKKGVDGADLRSITDDSTAQTFRKKIERNRLTEEEFSYILI